MHDVFPGERTATSTTVRRADVRDRGRANRAALAEILKSEILPCLIAANPQPARLRGRGAPPADPLALARDLLRGREAQARAAISARVAGGVAAATLLVEDFAPAARALGPFWERDEYDFVDVTLAARALHSLLRDIAPPAPRPQPHAPKLLIAPAPGDGHSFGAEVAAGMFRLGGWRARSCGFAEACGRLSEEEFDAMGVSATCERGRADLPAALAQARAASRNPHIKVLLGGPVLASQPGLAESLGADARAPEGDVDVAYTQSVLRSFRL